MITSEIKSGRIYSNKAPLTIFNVGFWAYLSAEKRTGRDSVLERKLKCVGKLLFFPAESMCAHFKQQIHLTMYSMTFPLTKTIKAPYIPTMNAGPVLCTFGLVCFTAQGADIE
jgi:hypothetical protein